MDSVNHVFFNVDEFHVLKAEKSKMIIYSNGKDPLFVDSTSKKDYFPTVYALSMFPKLLKISLILKDGTDSNLGKTGQLTWNNVQNLDQLDNFSADDVISIVKSNAEIFAIGALAIGAQDLKKSDDKSGLAAYILHYVGDQMFQIGSGTVKPIIYNGPEKKDELVEEAGDQGEDSDDDDLAAFANVGKEKKTSGGSKQKGSNKFNPQKVTTSTKAPVKINDQKVNKEEKSSKHHDDDFDDDKKGNKNKKKKPHPKAHKDEACDDEDGNNQKIKQGGSTKNMDTNIKEAFLNCLILTVDDKILPLDNSIMWKDHIIPCKNPEVELDVKASTYKTFGKFFQTMDKEGLIVYKEANKKSSTPQITEILRSNDQLQNWEPTISEPSNKKHKDDEKQENAKIEITKTVKNMCKPKDIVKKYMDKISDDYIEHKDYIKKVEEFLKNKGLLKKKEVTIDDDIKQDFGLDDEESEEEIEDEEKANTDNKERRTGPKHHIDFDKLISIMDKNIIYVHKIIDKKTGTEIVKDGKFPGVGLFAEKAHGKFITRVSHLGELGIDLDKILADWEKRFNTTGSIHETMEAKSKIKEITLQGTWFDQIKDYLTMELKVNEDMLTTVNKLDKKKKKK